MIFCNAVSKELVASYIRVFKGLDISLKSINTSLNAQISLIKLNPFTAKENQIVVVLDSTSLTSVLYIDGKYSFSSRSRLLEARGTEGSRMELVRALSSLIQFAEDHEIHLYLRPYRGRGGTLPEDFRNARLPGNYTSGM